MEYQLCNEQGMGLAWEVDDNHSNCCPLGVRQ